MQVVAWGRQRGLARAPCRFAPCFAGVTWTSHESISDSNCNTSFITSFNHLHHHTPRGECRFQRERNSVASGLWRRTPQKLKAKRRKPSKAFRFSPSQIPVDEIFSSFVSSSLPPGSSYDHGSRQKGDCCTEGSNQGSATHVDTSMPCLAKTAGQKV